MVVGVSTGHRRPLFLNPPEFASVWPVWRCPVPLEGRLRRPLPPARSACDACRVSTVPDCRALRRWWEFSREQAHIPAE